MWIVVDVESDGPIPVEFSMISFGAVVVNPRMNQTFYGTVKPISENWIPEALAVSGHSREDCLKFERPEIVIPKFCEWLDKIKRVDGRLTFVSDNNGFDWQFINYYLYKYSGRNPFGFSSRRIGDIYSGLKNDLGAQSKWKGLRKTAHTHNPVDDAKGNAEALIALSKSMKGSNLFS